METDKLKEFKEKYGMGWKPDLPDPRDYYYATPGRMLAQLPPKVDLRSQCPPIFDQGHLGSCTANSGGSLWQFVAQKTGMQSFIPSRLFLYYNTRLLEGNQDSDSGASLRETIKSLVKDGSCNEILWTYDDSTPKFTQRPPDVCYVEGQKHQVLSYQKILQNIQQIKGSLAEGFPFIFGFSVYESFYSISEDGMMPMPNINYERFLGGHAVMAVGYDDEKQAIIIQNSWSDDWGDNGYFYMPYSYVTDNYCRDFWTIRLVE